MSLIELLSSPKAIKVEETEELEDKRPIQIGKKFIPYNVKQRLMEQQDLNTLELMKQAHLKMHKVEPVIEKTEELDIAQASMEEIERDILSAELK